MSVDFEHPVDALEDVGDNLLLLGALQPADKRLDQQRLVDKRLLFLQYLRLCICLLVLDDAVVVAFQQELEKLLDLIFGRAVNEVGQHIHSLIEEILILDLASQHADLPQRHVIQVQLLDHGGCLLIIAEEQQVGVHEDGPLNNSDAVVGDVRAYHE